MGFSISNIDTYVSSWLTSPLNRELSAKVSYPPGPSSITLFTGASNQAHKNWPCHLSSKIGIPYRRFQKTYTEIVPFGLTAGSSVVNYLFVTIAIRDVPDIEVGDVEPP